MKIESLDDLRKVREQAKEGISVREGGDVKIVVGMGTCGIAAGAREVLSAVLEELAERNIVGVDVTQTGCAGLCEHEPLLEVITEDQPRVVYGKVTPDRARKIVVQHLINRQIVGEWVLKKD